MKKNFDRPGSWFLVPVPEKGFAIGVIARRSNLGVLFGYFFKSAFRAAEEDISIEKFVLGNELLSGKFSSFSLKDGSWPIVWVDERFDSSAWPMPRFVRIDSVSGDIDEIELDQKTFKPVARFAGDRSSIRSLPIDRMMGSIAVSRHLAALWESAD